MDSTFVVIIIWIICAFIAGWISSSKGQPFSKGFFLGLFAGIFGVLFAMIFIPNITKEDVEQLKADEAFAKEIQQNPIHPPQPNSDLSEHGFGIVSVSRKNDKAGRAIKIGVFINDHKVGVVGAKETIDFNIPAGNCVVYLKTWDSKSNVLGFKLESGQRVSLSNRSMLLTREQSPASPINEPVKNDEPQIKVTETAKETVPSENNEIEDTKENKREMELHNTIVGDVAEVSNAEASEHVNIPKLQNTESAPKVNRQERSVQKSNKPTAFIVGTLLFIGICLILGFAFVAQKSIIALSNFTRNVEQKPSSASGTNPTINEISTSVAATIIADMTKTQAAVPAISVLAEQASNTPTIVATLTTQSTSTPIPTNSPVQQVIYVTQIIPVTATIYIHPTASPTTTFFHNTPPTFIYPPNGGTIDYEGAYLFKVNSVQDADGYLWSFYQDGIMVWENLRDEGQLSGTEYGIHTDSIAHTKFIVGYIEVWVRASIAGQWTDATVITLYLKPRE